MNEPKGNGKADAACRTALRVAIRTKDTPMVQRVLERYGNYLLLIGETEPVGEVRVYVR